VVPAAVAQRREHLGPDATMALTVLRQTIRPHLENESDALHRQPPRARILPEACAERGMRKWSAAAGRDSARPRLVLGLRLLLRLLRLVGLVVRLFRVGLVGLLLRGLVLLLFGLLVLLVRVRGVLLGRVILQRVLLGGRVLALLEGLGVRVGLGRLG